MIPFGAYQLYQTERAVTEHERHMIDVRSGELVASLCEIGSSFSRRAKALSNLVRRVPRVTTTTLAEN